MYRLVCLLTVRAPPLSLARRFSHAFVTQLVASFLAFTMPTPPASRASRNAHAAARKNHKFNEKLVNALKGTVTASYIPGLGENAIEIHSDQVMFGHLRRARRL